MLKIPVITNSREVAEFIRHCAYQERAVSSIGRSTKAKRAEHERAAVVLENVANLLDSATTSEQYRKTGKAF